LFTALAAIVTSVGGVLGGFLLYRSQGYKARAEGDLTYAEMAEKAWAEMVALRTEMTNLRAELAAQKRDNGLQVRRWILAEPLLEEYAAGNPVREALVAEIRLLNGLHTIDKGGER